MVGFYVSIMFLGIMLILFSLLWIAYDRKKSFDHAMELKDKKEELINIINDAELIVEELNKFSDYVVTKVDEKSKEIVDILKNAEEKKALYQKEDFIVESVKLKKAVNSSINRRVDSISASKKREYVSNLEKSESKAEIKVENKVETKSQGNFETKTETKDGAEFKTKCHVKSDNVIHINGKYKEVIDLSNNGLNETEIARKLNMGKGEIRLILYKSQ